MNARTYPLPRPDDNAVRFGVAYDVARCLERLGLPRLTIADIAELRTLLFAFLYAPDTAPTVTVLELDRPSAFRQIAGACITCGEGPLDEKSRDGVCGDCHTAAAIAVREAGLASARAEEDRIAGELAVVRVELVLGDADEDFEFYPLPGEDRHDPFGGPAEHGIYQNGGHQ